MSTPAPTLATRSARVVLLNAPTLNFAMEQSGVPLIREALIRNLSARALGALSLELQLLPALGEAMRVPVPPLPVGEEVSLGVIDLRLPAGRLRSVLESERAQLHWVLREDTTTLAEGASDVEVLPYNHWPGTRAPLGLLTTFVTPNHPVIPELLKDVSGLLKQALGDGSLSGYQRRNPAHVRAMIAALYEAVQSLGLGYTEAAASFESHGQKVRLPDQLLRERMGCCLDLTLLFASALEAMGLHPLLLLIQDHALPAVWLIDERFPEGLVEDAARLRNLVALGHLLPFDASTAVNAGRPTFDRAVAVGLEYLSDDARFLAALDVSVLRLDRYRPLPLRAVEPLPQELPSPEPAHARLRAILESAAATPLPAEVTPPTAQVVSRFSKWKEKLLDLTLRNKLLNFRLDTRSALPLHMPDLAAFEDTLSGGDAFEILSAPELDARDAREAKLQQTRGTEEELAARRQHDLGKGLLHSPLREAELWPRAKHIERTARTDLEEGGAHTLYLALGLLRWFEEGDATPRLAPLLLYPASFRIDRARKRLRIERLPDEPLGNATLVEKLKRDYGLDVSALTTFEPDEKGLDVAAILRAVRTSIQSRPGWEVLEDAHIGLFTFTKFLMWKDLEDNEPVLLSNPLVRHIAASGTSTPPVSGREFVPEHLDTEVPASELPCVVNADSTQLAAIASALSGRSFVLQGPPGTGKSQTITNLIAAALARGKTVLFVSEKMAALEVVHRRLKDVGLDDFCLELHSHKSNKKEVLASFGRAYERTRRTPEPPWETRSGELTSTREALNAYVRALHHPWPLGQSFYGATSRLLLLLDAPEVRLSLASPRSFTESQFREARHEIEGLASMLRALRALGPHPWGAVRGVTWTHSFEEQVYLALSEARSALDNVEQAAVPLAASLGIDVPASTQGLRSLADSGEVLASGPVPSVALLDDAWPEVSQKMKEQALALREQSSRETHLASRWQTGLFTQDLAALHARFQKWAGAFFLFAFFFLWSTRKLLTALATRELPSNRDIEKDLATARQVLEWRPKLAEQARALAGALRGISAQELERPEALEALVQRSIHTRDLRNALGVSRVQIPTDSTSREVLSSQAAALRTALERLMRAEENLAGLLRARPWEPVSSAQHRASLRRQVEAWKPGLRSLRSWCLYQAQADKVRALGYGAFVDAVEAQGLAADQLSAAFERAVLTAWTRALRDAEPVLRDFEVHAHSMRVERFRQLDGEHVSLSRQRVISALEQKLPAGLATAAESSEPGILARELRKKRGQLALRRLLASIPNLARRLKPCFLMSPLSVAQYLPADGQRFDLLVFDEASQIGTHDAIGAIARAGQVIVVGDSKQLPPTTFFTRSEDPEATPDENDVIELESILEESLAKQLPQQMLGWHYRSRHDSLIDFSNRQYYEGRLHVFPAARAHVEDLGIKWHPVPDGVYQSKTSGKTAAINPREAEVLVAELVKALRRYAPHERTFGVVTFSVVQQQIILDLLDAERARSPEIEAHFSSSEPVFVKNLENVQGDERDEIFFSICYAKDAAGKLRMSFGPLSRAGGERRLNVAVTRARCALRVFSTLTHDQIDLSRTSSMGARHLREFLRRAAEAGSFTAAAAAREPEGALEQKVAAALRGLGYEVHTDVGCGGYRVGLAVVHPERPGEYVLGVECDGAHYHSAANARDRDRLRAEVLQGLGWRLHRVWSLGWAENREGQLKELEAEVRRALEDSKQAPAPATVPQNQWVKALPELSPEAEASATDTLERPAPIGAAATPTSPVQAYVPAKIPAVTEGTDFFAPKSALRLREQIQAVLNQEAPLHEDLLARRILDAWGLSKLTPRVRQRIEEQTGELAKRGMVLIQGEFLWSSTRGPSQYTGFRGAHAEREAAQLPPEEVANAAESVLSQSLSLGREDLLRETGRLFGIQRLTRTVLPVLEAGLELLIRRGRCTPDGDRAVWKE
jgi:very-short-patch-repair endonuclease